MLDTECWMLEGQEARRVGSKRSVNQRIEGRNHKSGSTIRHSRGDGNPFFSTNIFSPSLRLRLSGNSEIKWKVERPQLEGGEKYIGGPCVDRNRNMQFKGVNNLGLDTVAYKTPPCKDMKKQGRVLHPIQIKISKRSVPLALCAMRF
jgi:hypothetical protein